MTERKPLEWHSEDGELGWPLCGECMAEMLKPGLVEACASVGIEHAKSTAEMMKLYLDGFHARRHEPA